MSDERRGSPPGTGAGDRRVSSEQSKAVPPYRPDRELITDIEKVQKPVPDNSR